MLDFLIINVNAKKKNNSVEIYPEFIIKESSDLMIRGRDFYAIWVEDKKMWSTNEYEAISLIDKELEIFSKKYKDENPWMNVHTLYMWNSSSGMIDQWHKYCQKQMRDSYTLLDDKLIFSNVETSKRDYASKKLNYPLQSGSIDAYDKLIGTLYSEEERMKIEWAIGSIISGESKNIQKFMVLYGSAGTGKSTILNIIQKLFDGYYSVFDAKALGSSSNVFALEAFKNNPLVAIQHDGDLSRIEDNTRLNSLVSHELMTINEKFKATYSNRFRSFLFMGTNKPVKITDAKSGLIRRLIDVTPTGNKLPLEEYQKLIKCIDFELGAIAYHCLHVYENHKDYYDSYIPIAMMGASNDFYNFVEDSYFKFKSEDSTTLKIAWEMYNTYCDEAKVSFPMPKRLFKEELKNYFKDYKDRYTIDGERYRNYYIGFRLDKFNGESEPDVNVVQPSIIFEQSESILDEELADCLAQYASKDETPLKKWDQVKTKLKKIDTSKLHYVKVPENHIVIDFDIKDENGEKSFDLNLKEASKWPVTYAELSKSGNGIHLHYIYDGDPTELQRVYSNDIEVKVFTGNSSLRRKLTKCCNNKIATINSGLPIRERKKMINKKTVSNEKGLRILIKKNLNKEIHPGTKPSVDFIKTILDEAYDSGMVYDVSDMHQAILVFAMKSTHQAEHCVQLVNEMKFKSKVEEVVNISDKDIVFYDVEVFPNLFLINFKKMGDGKTIHRLINPNSQDVDRLMQYRLVGFNCRRYDNHILYGRLIGYTNEQLYKLSKRIISGDKNAFFGAAYNISYTDVYDFSSKKQSLKKWEIELGIPHKELGFDWDKEVPKEKWEEVAAYCDNDVVATEAVFNHLKQDWIAREILAEIAGKTVNDTTNSLSTAIIFGTNKSPQNEFNYRFMGTELLPWDMSVEDYTMFNDKGQPVFPGYTFERGVSTYRGEVIGEGGYVYAEPGFYINVALLDVESMHPSSLENEVLFGERYTARFSEIKKARVNIKHGNIEEAKKMFNGVLAKYLDGDGIDGLSYALKIVINSVYGLTSARFQNPFRDIRNVDNIVAKRGALFMVNLKYEVMSRGYTVAHIKTDSIKIPNADESIIEFVNEYGKKYGYKFDHEATYSKMCLVNDAVYIAKYDKPKVDKKTGKEKWWTATGTQFKVPYVFKKLFSNDEIIFSDMRETKSVTGKMYIDMNESLDDYEPLEKEFKKLQKKNPDDPKLIELKNEIDKCHDYHFIGKVGSFCPIKPGCGGGELFREQNGSYYAVTGTKGYRWMESEIVQELNKQDDIDLRYYDNLVQDAIDEISKYVDFEHFSS